MIESITTQLVAELAKLPDAERMDALNAVRLALHDISPMKNEPVDCVLWIDAEQIVANDYNPNKVAKPEMQLLYRSIKEDGYTQPIVTIKDGNNRIVVDGFHRNLVGRTKKDIAIRIMGRLPVVAIDKDMKERIASTVRHNRARGEHTVNLMADLVNRLVGLGWEDSQIAKYLGMTGDELIRLKQQLGIAQLFANQPYSRSWVATGPLEDDEITEVQDAD